MRPAPARKIATVPARQNPANQDHSQPQAQTQILDNSQVRRTPEQAAKALTVQAAFPLEPIVGQSLCREHEVHRKRAKQQNDFIIQHDFPEPQRPNGLITVIANKT